MDGLTLQGIGGVDTFDFHQVLPRCGFDFRNLINSRVGHVIHPTAGWINMTFGPDTEDKGY